MTSSPSVADLAPPRSPALWPNAAPESSSSNRSAASETASAENTFAPWGVAEAKELGIFEILRRNCASELPWADLGFGLGNLLETTPQRLPGLSSSHPEMQEALLAAAEAISTEVRRGVTVERIETGQQSS